MVRHCLLSLFCVVAYTALVFPAAGDAGGNSLERETDGASWRDHHYSDGEHNAEFDHEIILGSVQLAEEFQKLEPEEAKRKLEEILVIKDLNGDRFIDKNELRIWILDSFKSLSKEDATRRMEELDTNKDNKVSWSEHLQDTFGVDKEDEITLEDMGESGVMLQDEREMFAAADADGDGQLDAAEFEVFASPEEHEVLQPFVLRQTMRERDANRDGRIDFKEFLGDREGGESSSTLELSERIRFDDEDRDRDGSLDAAEVRRWVLPDNEEIAAEEVEHILSQADADGDGRLAFAEVLARHELFVGSAGSAEDLSDEDDFQHFDDEL